MSDDNAANGQQPVAYDAEGLLAVRSAGRAGAHAGHRFWQASRARCAFN